MADAFIAFIVFIQKQLLLLSYFFSSMNYYYIFPRPSIKITLLSTIKVIWVSSLIFMLMDLEYHLISGSTFLWQDLYFAFFKLKTSDGYHCS